VNQHQFVPIYLPVSAYLSASPLLVDAASLATLSQYEVSVTKGVTKSFRASWIWFQCFTSLKSYY